MRDCVEVALQVGVDDVGVARFEQFIDSSQCVFASPVGAKAVTVFGEFVLEDWFYHHSHCRLNHPVSDRRDAQRPLLLRPRFGDVVSADCLRAVSPVPQVFAESPQFLVQSSLKHRDRDVVDPGGSLVRSDLRERGL